MAAKPIFVQAVDTNGTPYSGAKLNVYDAGTTTPRAIYTESGLGTASANPAIADANGVVVVWVNDAGGDIKVTLTNSAETVTPHNEDNVPIASLTCYPVITFQGDQSLLTTSSPTFAGLTLGNVSFAGVVTDPNADRLFFWDDSADQVNFMTLGTGLAFNGTALELDGDLQDISGLTPTDGGVIIGDGTDFVIESGPTLRASLGVAIGSDVLAYDANLQGFADAFTAPTSDGLAGQFLVTDGAGNLTFDAPAGGGDTLAAANETITGDWDFQGDLQRNSVTIPLAPANYASHSAYLSDQSDDLVTETSTVAPAGGVKRTIPVAISSSATIDRGLKLNQITDFSVSGVIETTGTENVIAIDDTASRFRIHDVYASSGKSGADSWIMSVKPAQFADSVVLDAEITSVDTGTETLTSTAHGFVNGDFVIYETTGDEIGGLDNRGQYYIVGATTNTFQLSATSGGAAINLTSAGSGTQFVKNNNFWAEDGAIYGNTFRGTSNDVAAGITIDGDTRNLIAVANNISNIRRVSNGSRAGHAIAVAGDIDPNADSATSKDAFNILVALNTISDADNMFHSEDDNPGLVFAFNAGRDITRGLEVINSEGGYCQSYIANTISGPTEYFLTGEGTGSLEDINILANVFDGAGVTQTGTNGAVRINQIDTKNINYAFNIHRDVVSTAFYSNAQGPFNILGNTFDDITGDAVHWARDGALARIAYNHFDSVSGDALLASGTERFDLASLRPVLVESNNTFENITGSIVDTANSQMIKGDQTLWSDELDGSIAAESLLLAAPRAGVLTAVARVYSTAGGGGSTNGTFTIKKIPEGGGAATTLLSNSVARFSTQYDSNVWTSVSAQMLVGNFSAGDILLVESGGEADRSTRFRVMIEFFYYN